MTNNYFCYLLTCEKNRTYTGITNNLMRLRKHNGLVKGGAKSTRISKNWRYHTIVEGFNNASEAASFEWHWKHNKNKCGLANKMKRLLELLIDNKWHHIKFKNLIFEEMLPLYL
mgnify:CR=1 FL=1